MLEELLENTEDLVYFKDREGRYERASRAFEEKLGVAPEDMVGSTASEVFPDGLGNIFAEEDRKVMDTGEVVRSETETEVDGERLWLSTVKVPRYGDGGDVIGMMGISRDVTRRKEAEIEEKLRREELKEKTEVYSSIFDCSDDSIFIIQGGLFVEANESFAELMDTTRENLIGEEFIHRVAPEYREMVKERYRERMGGGNPPSRYEIEGYTTTGRRVPLELNLSIVPYQGEPADLCMARDITERQQNRRQMEVMDRIFRHNLRNQVNLAKGQLQEVRERVGLDGEGGDAIDEVDDTVDDIFTLSEKAHRITKLLLEKPSPETVEVNPLVENRVERAEEEFPSATFSFTGTDGVVVKALPQVERAVDELLENAVVHASCREPEILVEVTEGDSWAEVSVKDFGPEIPDDEVAVLTGEEELDPLFHGSGLGLWLVNWVAQRSMGEITTDREDGGNVVKILLQKSGGS